MSPFSLSYNQLAQVENETQVFLNSTFAPNSPCRFSCRHFARVLSLTGFVNPTFLNFTILLRTFEVYFPKQLVP